jgi:hypothetical protein
MKNISIFLLFNMSLFTSVFAAGSVETNKVFDGTLRSCQDEFYTQAKTGLYRAKALDISPIGTDKVRLNVQLEFFKCAVDASSTASAPKYKLVYARPYEKLEQIATDSDGLQIEYTVEAKEIRVRATQDGVYKLVVDSKLDEKTEAKTIISFDIKLSDLRIDSVRSSVLNKTVYDLDFYITKDFDYNFVDDSDRSFSQTVSYGVYRVRFSVK